MKGRIPCLLLEEESSTQEKQGEKPDGQVQGAREQHRLPAAGVGAARKRGLGNCSGQEAPEEAASSRESAPSAPSPLAHCCIAFKGTVTGLPRLRKRKWSLLTG